MATLRRKVFTIARKLVRHRRRVVLSLTRPFPRQEMFESVLAPVEGEYGAARDAAMAQARLRPGR